MSWQALGQEPPAPPVSTEKPPQAAFSVEQRQSAQLEDLAAQINDGSNVTWLTTDADERFLVLYRADQTGLRQGGVILLHDQGQHLNWPGLLQTLRTALPQEGWATLTVALPPYIPTTDPKTPEQDNRDDYLARSQQRLTRALSFWDTVEQGPLAIILFGLSSHAWYAATEAGLKTPNIRGQVLVDGYQLLPSTTFNLTQVIFKQGTPIMDWLRTTDNRISQGEQRHIKAKQNNLPDYTSHPLPTTPKFSDIDLILISKKINQWLNKLIESKETQKKKS